MLWVYFLLGVDHHVLKFFMIAAGGSIGAVLRYLMVSWGQRLTDSPFPIGTIMVNVLGCLIIGFAGARFLGSNQISEHYRMLLFVGLLGGFTTFSTFGWETFVLINDGHILKAMINILITNIVALGAVWVGYQLGERIFGLS